MDNLLDVHQMQIAALIACGMNEWAEEGKAIRKCGGVLLNDIGNKKCFDVSTPKELSDCTTAWVCCDVQIVTMHALMCGGRCTYIRDIKYHYGW